MLIASRRIILKSEYKNVSISIDTILYIEPIDNYVKVHLVEGTSVLSKISLHAIEEQLAKEEFIRIHRSYLVPRCCINVFSRSEVTLGKDGITLPIGKKYLNDVILML